jgi:membrane protein
MTLHEGWILLRRTFAAWNTHCAQRLGAALAFYSLLSLAPLLVLVVAIVAFVFGEQAARNEVAHEIQGLLGYDVARAVQNVIQDANRPGSGVLAGALALVTTLFGASAVLKELRDALNTMWDVEPSSASGWKILLREQIFSFGMILSIGFLLIISLVFSSILAAIGKFFGSLVATPLVLLEVFNFAVSFATITFAFGLIFKFVPDRRILWRDVWIGAMGTALLFTAGKASLGLYIGRAGVGSAYGAAGSLVVVVVWVYYSAQIFLFGAEFTHIYASARREGLLSTLDRQDVGGLASAVRSERASGQDE